MSNRQNGKYDENYKEKCVKAYLLSGKTAKETAKELNIPYKTFLIWLEETDLKDEIKSKVEYVLTNSSSVDGMDVDEIILLDKYIDKISDTEDYSLLEKIGIFYKESGYMELALTFLKKSVEKGGSSHKKLEEYKEIIRKNKIKNIDSIGFIPAVEEEIEPLLDKYKDLSDVNEEDGKDLILLISRVLVLYDKKLSYTRSISYCGVEYGAVDRSDEISVLSKKIRNYKKILKLLKKLQKEK